MSKEIQFQTEFKQFPEEKKDGEINASLDDPDVIDALPRKWIHSARAGQVINIGNKLFAITAEALKSSLGTWEKGIIFENHKDQKRGFKIYGTRYEDPFLDFLLDSDTLNELEKGTGGSIDAIATELKDDKVMKITGVGYSILNEGQMPSCTKAAGCGVPIAGEVKIAGIDTEWDFNRADYTLEQLEKACAWSDTSRPKDKLTKTDYKLGFKTPNGTIVFRGVVAAMAALNGARQDVNIPKGDVKTVYNILTAAYKLFNKEPPELKAAISAASESKDKGGSEEKMADKEEKSAETYTTKQVAEIRAAAVTEVTEQLVALEKVATGEAEKAHAAELKTLGEAHAAALVKQHDEVQKQTAMIETLSTKYALSDKAKEQLMGAKTMDEALTLFASLKVEKAEPVVEAEGGKVSGSGIVMGAGKIEAKAPKTVKVEEVGTYNPYTRKYEPTYREEMI
jgi:hypothetical protein